MTAAAPAPLDFYFDFLSPFGYFAASRVDALAARYGREVRWRAFYMRGIMQERLGQTRPFLEVPIKGDYYRHDVPRMARWFGLPLKSGGLANFISAHACRAFWVIHDHDPALAKRFAWEIFEWHHARATPPNTPEQVAQAAANVGWDVAHGDLALAVQQPAAKVRLRDETDAAAEAGVWGTPTFIVDGEVFWGADRLYLVEDWLRRGGW
ncbi:DsbA family protein [Achromobacter sp. GG226]|uniref:2-hydroxychromene-2-carboxylate isomerase n=1 Tax=Verticiella alkaliphila TaxID=2779529 RepID=UPI001C0B6D76|nr:DsbA family protein [Verticiella sp. GG226]MBU4611865.1 DsbA family protein [Verticiella sp. GG226]